MLSPSRRQEMIFSHWHLDREAMKSAPTNVQTSVWREAGPGSKVAGNMVTKVRDSPEFSVSLGAIEWTRGYHVFDWIIDKHRESYVYVGVASPNIEQDQSFCRESAENQTWYYFGCGYTCALRNGWTDVVSKESNGVKVPKLCAGERVRAMLDLDKGELSFVLYGGSDQSVREVPGKLTGIRGPVVAACCLQNRSDNITLTIPARPFNTQDMSLVKSYEAFTWKEDFVSSPGSSSTNHHDAATTKEDSVNAQAANANAQAGRVAMLAVESRPGHAEQTADAHAYTHSPNPHRSWLTDRNSLKWRAAFSTWNSERSRSRTYASMWIGNMRQTRPQADRGEGKGGGRIEGGVEGGWKGREKREADAQRRRLFGKTGSQSLTGSEMRALARLTPGPEPKPRSGSAWRAGSMTWMDRGLDVLASTGSLDVPVSRAGSAGGQRAGIFLDHQQRTDDLNESYTEGFSSNHCTRYQAGSPGLLGRRPKSSHDTRSNRFRDFHDGSGMLQALPQVSPTGAGIHWQPDPLTIITTGVRPSFRRPSQPSLPVKRHDEECLLITGIRNTPPVSVVGLKRDDSPNWLHRHKSDTLTAIERRAARAAFMLSSNAAFPDRTRRPQDRSRRDQEDEHRAKVLDIFSPQSAQQRQVEPASPHSPLPHSGSETTSYQSPIAYSPHSGSEGVGSPQTQIKVYNEPGGCAGKSPQVVKYSYVPPRTLSQHVRSRR